MASAAPRQPEAEVKPGAHGALHAHTMGVSRKVPGKHEVDHDNLQECSEGIDVEEFGHGHPFL